MIDEKKLIEDLNKNAKALYSLDNFTPVSAWKTEELIEFINKLPQINQWIPCSERLPENLDDYLVMLEDEYGELHIRIVEYGKYTWTNKPPYSDVLAWQPLPQPYKGE